MAMFQSYNTIASVNTYTGVASQITIRMREDEWPEADPHVPLPFQPCLARCAAGSNDGALDLVMAVSSARSGSEASGNYAIVLR
jgi:hypothetical protein